MYRLTFSHACTLLIIITQLAFPMSDTTKNLYQLKNKTITFHSVSYSTTRIYSQSKYALTPTHSHSHQTASTWWEEPNTQKLSCSLHSVLYSGQGGSWPHSHSHYHTLFPFLRSGWRSSQVHCSRHSYLWCANGCSSCCSSFHCSPVYCSY